MIDLMNTIRIYTTLQLVYTLSFILIPLITLAIYSRIKTDDKRIVKVIILSSLPLILLSIAIPYFFTLLTGIHTASTIHMGFGVAILINILNLSVLVSSYMNDLNTKQPDVDHVTRDHFDSSINTIVAVVIIGLGFIPFVPYSMIATLTMLMFTSVGTIIFNIITSKRFLIDLSNSNE